MSMRRGRGLAAIGTIGSLACAAAAAAQPYLESPPWGATQRAMTMQVAPAMGQPSQSHTTSPRSAAPGGPLTAMPLHTVPKPGRGLPPATSAWQSEARPKSASLEGARTPVATGRRVVAFSAAYPAGALVIVNRERALYHVGPDGKATRYPVAIGSFTEEWTGVEFITDKKMHPTWHPVQEPGKEPREPVPGGDPANPLGARALYLGRTLWRIHGTPAADSIGQAVSSGCIRMHNDHVIELYDTVMLGAEVYVVDRLADAAPAHRGRKVIE